MEIQNAMFDIIYTLASVGYFALMIIFIRLCDKI
jgi:hypothetical protein